MVKHIVLFRITEFSSDGDRQEKARFLKTAFEKLKNKIKVIKKYEVELNVNSSSSAYDVAIYSEFRTWEDLQAYQSHPDHLYAVEQCRAVAKIKALADYEK